MENIFKKGDKVYHWRYKWGEVIDIRGGDVTYCVKVLFEDSLQFFTMEGYDINWFKVLSFTEYDFIKGGLSLAREESTAIFLIEKAWLDPMENREATGYEPFGYKTTEQEAKDFCESKGHYTEKDCWQVQFHKNKQMPKYRYKEIKYCV